MAAPIEQVQYGHLNTEHPLCVSGRPKSQHRPLSDSGAAVRCFDSIVCVLRRIVRDTCYLRPMRDAIAAQLVRDKPIRRPLLRFEQLPDKPCGCSPVAPSLHQDIEKVAVLVDGAPQLLTSPLDLQEDLVQQPVVARCRLTSRASCGPNRRHPRRIVSELTAIPRCARRSSTSRRLRGNR